MRVVRSLLVLILLISAGNIFAQNTDRFWVFGDSAAIDFSDVSNPTPSWSVLRSRGSSATICDSIGNLLFYASTPRVPPWPYTSYAQEGYVINRNQQLMQNGDIIVGEGWYQEMVIISDPGNPIGYYLFCAGELAPIIGLFYSKIDLSYNNGLGKVTQKNVQINTDSIADGITAVRHGNGRDWWVIARNWKTQLTDDIMVFLIDPSGVTAIPKQHIGVPKFADTVVRMKFNQEGTRMYNVASPGIIERYDFDRCTGLFSNPIIYENTLVNFKNYWGFEVSPDESKIYTTSIYQTANQDTSYLIQFDLNASNFLASAETLYTFTAPNTPGILKLGPDNKIYLSTTWAGPDTCFDYLYCYGTVNTTNSNISVINRPDSAGVACDFQPFSFYLGGHKAYVGLPNNPNYELGAWVGSPCDTLAVGIGEVLGYKNNLSVFYDPRIKTAFVNAKGLRGKKATLQIFNSAGQLVFTHSSPTDGEYFTLDVDMSHYMDAMYVVRLETEKEMVGGKFFKK
jgi:hypothetical protein